MATTQIGQYRYTGKNCVTDISASSSIGYVSANADISTSSGTAFQDIAITPALAFGKDKDYYFRVKIPQDLNYDMEFNLKLTKSEDGGTVQYQFLKNVSVVKGGSGTNVYHVVLYEKSDGTAAAMLPLTYQAGTTNVKDYIYYDAANAAFYLGNGGTSYTRTTNFNQVYLSASWKTEIGENYGIFELVFRPVEDNFTSLLLQMVRQPEDYNIQKTVDGVVEYGRKVDKDKVTFTLYELTNLKTYMSSNNLTRIGVWGHSGLMMAVNGEEIHIGPSGYYELSQLEITSLGIVAPNDDYTNTFTVDYEYNISDDEGE